jgi:hypothetical protein
MFRPAHWLLSTLAAVLVAVPPPAESCCVAPPSGKPVVNADQTVILLWDAATNTQHFIRKASFKSDAADFGFLIPSPTKPELAESGNEAFPTLQNLTAPEIIRRPKPSGGVGCGCAAAPNRTFDAVGTQVTVLEQKLVAGFDAAVLEATSAKALTDWLKDHGYAYSPEIAIWAKPYVEQGWKVTALKVAKPAGGKTDQSVAASALRLSFKTDRPLFPYREPDPTSAAKALGASQRLLRIYFLAGARYRGELTKETPWTGKVAWAGRVSQENRAKVLEQLRLPITTGAAEWWLTEFEDPWPYRAAPADVSFARDADQGEVKRPPVVQYVSAPARPDGGVFVFAAALALLPLLTRLRRWWV